MLLGLFEGARNFKSLLASTNGRAARRGASYLGNLCQSEIETAERVRSNYGHGWISPISKSRSGQLPGQHIKCCSSPWSRRPGDALNFAVLDAHTVLVASYSHLPSVVSPITLAELPLLSWVLSPAVVQMSPDYCCPQSWMLPLVSSGISKVLRYTASSSIIVVLATCRSRLCILLRPWMQQCTS